MSFKGKPCYYCGKPATSKEHVPPKQIFAAFECDSITVPSCHEHNLSKGALDQAVVSALLLPLSNGKGRYNLGPEVIRALGKAQPAFERTKKRVFSAALVDISKTPVMKSLPFVSYTTESMFGWMRQVTAGLVYDAIRAFDHRIDWDNTGSWSPSFVSSLPGTKYDGTNLYNEFRERSVWERDTLGSLDWFEGWSAKPRPYPKSIFRFQVHFEHREILFRFRLYSQYSWYVAFQPSVKTQRMLWQRVLEYILKP
jgi:hypothetical protein